MVSLTWHHIKVYLNFSTVNYVASWSILERTTPSYNAGPNKILITHQTITLLTFVPSLAPTLKLATTTPMAITAQLSFSLLLPSYHHHHHLKPNSTLSFRSSRVRAVGGGSDILGDFGARDPFPAEIASGFADKVLGNGNTEHKILIPNLSALSLSQQPCTPLSPFQSPMSTLDAHKLLKKVLLFLTFICLFLSF